ncbi:uncharacterized protein LOC135498674 [Lineus longissimus]|uniref:uncharacterized protein LOC135498674 n=1 Tax=Lineus longissimus TaxID=88925 RepID=UPI00315D8C01
MLSPDLQVWMKDRKPETVERLTEWAELYVNSRKKSHIAKFAEPAKGSGDDSYDGNSFEVLLANGTTEKVLTAKVVLSGTRGKKECIVGVLERLPVDVLLSQQDFVVIGDLNEEPFSPMSLVSDARDLDGVPAFAVTTRARQKEQEAVAEWESRQPQAKPKAVGDLVQGNVKSESLDSTPVADSSGDVESPDDILSAEFLSDVQIAEGESNVPVDLPHLDMWRLGPTELAKRQKADVKLQKVLQKCERSLPKDSIGYFWRDGLAYRRSFMEGRQQYFDQLLVPQEYRLDLLDLAHSIPLAGHLGVTKTKGRLVEHYFWPGLHKDVEKYCSTIARSVQENWPLKRLPW